jgi:hypothetical protein
MHVILMGILTSHGGWFCVEKEVPQMSVLDACLTRSHGPSGEPVVQLGAPCWMPIWSSMGGRSRPNTVLAAAYDLKV